MKKRTIIEGAPALLSVQLQATSAQRVNTPLHQPGSGLQG